MNTKYQLTKRWVHAFKAFFFLVLVFEPTFWAVLLSLTPKPLFKSHINFYLQNYFGMQGLLLLNGVGHTCEGRSGEVWKQEH